MEIQKSSRDGKTEFRAEIAGKFLTLETGNLAMQTNGSCVARMGDTVVLATAVMSEEVREGIDFFPLMVDVEERLYAAGKIKGSRWIKREGRPSDEAVVTTRLVDRSVRPLFPSNLYNEVQVILTVLSVDNENDSDIVGLVAASAALAMSDIPWNGPIGGLRAGLVSEENAFRWVINPVFSEREKCVLDMVVAGTKDKVLMIEANASEVSEEQVMEGLEFSQNALQEVADFISAFAKETGKSKMEIAASVSSEAESKKELDEALALVKTWAEEHVAKAIFEKPLTSKEARKSVMKRLEGELSAYLESKSIGKERRKKAESFLPEFIERTVSEYILLKGKRVDGRALDEVRPLKADVAVLPRTHGSALFLRGETQVLSVVTLGSPGEEQMLEGIETNGKKRYMHHYNFPAFSVGETGPIRAPGRREIGHGALAERAVMPVLPPKEEFPYTIRVVSEILSSNGSSSMASVCGSALSLMDAGVPIKKPVAGIAMGLASGPDGAYKILTDLQDLEDSEGGMDFKIAGTKDGITVIQLDTKTDGLRLEICRETLKQARQARQEILDVMQKTIEKPRPDLSPFAPRVTTLKIDPKKIRDVIGTGGKVINEIVEKTGAQIEIEQDGTIFVSAVNAEASAKALEIIKDITRDIKEGEIFSGKVARIMDFGAIVQLTQNKDGMVHISELAPHRVNTVEDVVKLGDTVTVKVLHVDDQGKIGLSMRALHPGAGQESDNFRREDGGRDMRRSRMKGPHHDKRMFRR